MRGDGVHFARLLIVSRVMIAAVDEQRSYLFGQGPPLADVWGGRLTIPRSVPGEPYCVSTNPPAVEGICTRPWTLKPRDARSGASTRLASPSRRPLSASSAGRTARRSRTSLVSVRVGMRRLSCALRHQEDWEAGRALQRLDESRVAEQREIGMLQRALRDDERVRGPTDGFAHAHLGDLHPIEVVLVSRGPEFALQKPTDKPQLVFIEWRRRGGFIVGHRRGKMHDQCRGRRTYCFAGLPQRHALFVMGSPRPALQNRRTRLE